LLDAGLNEQNADLNAVVWTWTFRSGRWSSSRKPPTATPSAPTARATTT
jgi:hypothetical protein